MALFDEIKKALDENGCEYEINDSFLSHGENEPAFPNKRLTVSIGNIKIHADFADMEGEYFESWTIGDDVVEDINSSQYNFDDLYKLLSDPEGAVKDMIKYFKSRIRSAKAKMSRKRRMGDVYTMSEERTIAYYEGRIDLFAKAALS